MCVWCVCSVVVWWCGVYVCGVCGVECVVVCVVCVCGVCVCGVCVWCVGVFGVPGDQVYLDAAQVEAQRDGNLHLGLKEAQNNQ